MRKTKKVVAQPSKRVTLSEEARRQQAEARQEAEWLVRGEAQRRDTLRNRAKLSAC